MLGSSQSPVTLIPGNLTSWARTHKHTITFRKDILIPLIHGPPLLDPSVACFDCICRSPLQNFPVNLHFNKIHKVPALSKYQKLPEGEGTNLRPVSQAHVMVKGENRPTKLASGLYNVHRGMPLPSCTHTGHERNGFLNFLRISGHVYAHMCVFCL